MITRSLLAHDRFITEEKIISATEEYGFIVQKPIPSSANLGTISMDSGGVLFGDADLTVRLTQTGAIETSKYLWCRREDELAGNNWFGKNPVRQWLMYRMVGYVTPFEFTRDLVQTFDRDFLVLFIVANAPYWDLKIYRVDRDNYDNRTLVGTISTGESSDNASLAYDRIRDHLYCLYRAGSSNVLKKSIDGGTTWVEVYRGSDFGNWQRIAYSNNYLYVIVDDTTGPLDSADVWYSSDFGVTWSFLQNVTDVFSNQTYRTDLFVLDDGSFAFVYATFAGYDVSIRKAVPGSSFGAATTIYNDTNTHTFVTGCQVGKNIIVSWKSSAGTVYVSISTDGGTTWDTPVHLGPSSWGYSAFHVVMRKIDFKPHMIFTSTGTISIQNKSGMWVGYDWVNLTESVYFDRYSTFYDLPSEARLGWTSFGTSSKANQNDWAWRNITTAAQYGGYSRSDIADFSYTNGVKAKFRMRVTASTNPDGHGGLVLTPCDSAGSLNRTRFKVCVFTDKVDIYDFVSASYLGSFSHDFTTYHDFLVAVKGLSVKVWIRGEHEREWALALSKTLTNESSYGGGIYMTNADYQAAGLVGACTAYWRFCFYTYGDVSGDDDGLADGFVNPDDLIDMETRSELVHLSDGIEVSFVGGIGYVGDNWRVRTEYRFPKEAILRDSPSEIWRSIGDNRLVDIVFDAGSGNAFSINRFALVNSNFKNCKLVMASDSAFTSALATIDCSAVVTSGTISDHGEYFIKDTALRLSPKKWRGSILALIGGNGDFRFRIDDNDPSKIYCFDDEIDTTTDLDNGDPYSILADRMNGRSSGGTVVQRRYMKIRIPSQRTPEGFYQIGRAVLGREYQFEVDIDWEFTDDQTGNIVVQESLARLRYGSKRGERMRSVGVSWRGLGRNIIDTIRALFDYCDYQLQPVILFQDDSKSYEFLYGRLAGVLRLTNIVDALSESERHEYYHVNPFSIEEEL